MAKMTLGDYLKNAQNKLEKADLFVEDLAFLIEETLNLNPSQLKLRQDQILSDGEIIQFDRCLEQLLAGESPQYILGYSYFYDEKFIVNQNVLIPRFETEELVAWVIDDLHDAKTILDVGTGSGVIAAILAKKTNAKVSASDISAQALDVATQNFQQLDVAIKTYVADGLDGLGKFDIIVSNPPYIKTSEKNLMDSSVINNEPEMALFAGSDGMDFYRKFIASVDDHLNEEGTFYLEFGFEQKQLLMDLFMEELPNYSFEFRQDLSGHDRMVKGVKRLGNKIFIAS